jgi:hypothetical protein
MQDQHNRLCKQYKDSKTMDEAESRYLAIRAWWLSSGAASEDAIRDLNLWLAFWHFRYRQWGGCMQMVRPSSLAYLVIQSHIRLHNWTLNYNIISLLFQGLSLEEMADMPSCNLSETAHNKWLQQSSNRGNDLFVATCDDKIRVVMQMTNYRAYLKGKASEIGPSKQELKLRAARRSGDPKKIEEALNQLPGVEVATTRIPHLEGEEIFGSMKRKLDLPLGNDGNCHRTDKVNFSQP